MIGDVDEVICAIASPISGAVRGVVRVSGFDAMGLMASLGFAAQKKSAHHYSTTFDLGEPLGNVPVQILLWPNQRSYTGQSSAEIHTFGSLPILQSIVDRLCEAGARAARPGEFTLRAFLAGRLDLTQAEAVLGVIDAGGRGALDHALRQLAGNLSRPLEDIRAELLNLLADVEAGLDFVDEDIEFISDDDLVKRLMVIGEQISRTRDQMRQRGASRSETVVAIRGEPNVGKSRLLNALVGKQAAIVADVAGTTRDVVEVVTNMQGHDVRLIDTAGIETAENDSPDAVIVDAAQAQANRASREADIRIWCIDRTRGDWDKAANKLIAEASDGRLGAQDLWVATKCDHESLSVESPWISTSAVTGRGIDILRDEIARIVSTHDRDETGAVIGTAARCGETLRRAESAVTEAINTTRDQAGHEFVSAELRVTADCLGEVTGAVYTDDILDRVFSRFCIGK